MKKYFAICLGIFLLFSAVDAADAVEIWTGLDTTFTKEDFADWTLAVNQDQITDNVWITRRDNQGIFNIAVEDSYFDFSSPADTEWAYGSAADWASLDFSDWETWHGSDPLGFFGGLGIINQDAVVHLITDDIYIDINFLSWTSGADGGGGGFSYIRASAPVPEPATMLLLGTGLAGLGVFKIRRKKK